MLHHSDRMALLATTALTLMAGQALAQQAAQPQGQRAGALEEIVVTAERRESSLQDVAVSVSAFDENTLERRQISDILEIFKEVPNLIANNNVGQRSATTFFVRGVGNTESIATVDTTVGVYVDGVYIARQGVNNFSLLDVQRVEVLRGPQGTLYGRNSSGGAVKVILNKPQFEPSAFVEGAYGERNYMSFRAVGNVPVNDKIAFRISGYAEGEDGMHKNIALNKKVNDNETFGGRASVRFTPNDAFDVTISADYAKNDTNGLYPSNQLNNTTGATPNLRNVPFASTRIINSDQDIDNEATAWGFTGDATWTLNDSVSINSITGWRFSSQVYDLDISGRNPWTYILAANNDSHQFSQEFQMNADLGAFGNLVAGVYYFDERNDSVITDRLRIGAPITFVKDFNLRVKSYAAFGELKVPVFGGVSAILGGRVTRDKKDLRVVHFINGAANPAFNTQALIARGIEMDPRITKFTPKAGLEYQASDDILLYATFTQGFKGEGWQARVNNPAQFLNASAETVNSYEIGFKSTFAERFRLNGSAFIADYKDLVNTISGPGGTFLVSNADAKIKGAEFEATFVATEQLDFFATIGLLDTKYKSLLPAVDALLGDEIQRSPSFTGRAGFNYSVPLATGARIDLTSDVYYVSSYFTNPQNSLVGKTGDFALVGASVSYTTADDRFTFQLACTNCLDKEYFDSILDFATSGFSTVYNGPSRLIKGVVRARF